MTRIDVVYGEGKNKLIAIYKDGDLVATQDKFCKPADLEYCIAQHGGGKGAKVVESQATFQKFDEIPDKHDMKGGKTRGEVKYKCDFCKDRVGGCEKCGE